MENSYNLITILGPTASGKTTLATKLASHLNTEIISADSRQVYRGMDIGTGKDIDEYVVDGKLIPYHLIDIVDAGAKYNLFEYQKDFHAIFNKLNKKESLPIVCGGSGLYVESIVDNYNLVEVPINQVLRDELKLKSLEDLAQILKNIRKLHNKTDIDNKKRVIRAIEIEQYCQLHGEKKLDENIKINSLNIGVDISREMRREKISMRLTERLNNGMVEEVEDLLKIVSAEDLIYYGLEYKYLTLYLTGAMTFEEMKVKLEIEIHRFAKRQMTFFRKMEKKGIIINWIDANISTEKKIEKILNFL